MNKTYGLISNMQHFSIDDGPGIRTTIFMQGCNLKCTWCHNPETASMTPVIMLNKPLCTKCEMCKTACDFQAHIFNKEHCIDRDKCIRCGKCTLNCHSNALSISGKYISLEDVFNYIYEDIDYMNESGGGVTISGGEPLLQADFCALLAKKCKEANIHVIIDTAGNIAFSEFEKVIPYTDEFYYDIKSGDEHILKEKTGGNLSLVTDNLIKLIEKGAAVTVRIPVIPGVNYSYEELDKMYELIKKAGVTKVNLLPFHRLGVSKYASLDKQYDFADTLSLAKDDLKPYADIFKGISTVI